MHKFYCIFFLFVNQFGLLAQIKLAQSTYRESPTLSPTYPSLGMWHYFHAAGGRTMKSIPRSILDPFSVKALAMMPTDYQNSRWERRWPTRPPLGFTRSTARAEYKYMPLNGRSSDLDRDTLTWLSLPLISLWWN